MQQQVDYSFKITFVADWDVGTHCDFGYGLISSKDENRFKQDIATTNLRAIQVE
jgi:uncharacterized protein YigA (DUF484 family)